MTSADLSLVLSTLMRREGSSLSISTCSKMSLLCATALPADEDPTHASDPFTLSCRSACVILRRLHQIDPRQQRLHQTCDLCLSSSGQGCKRVQGTYWLAAMQPCVLHCCLAVLDNLRADTIRPGGLLPGLGSRKPSPGKSEEKNEAKLAVCWLGAPHLYLQQQSVTAAPGSLRKASFAACQTPPAYNTHKEDIPFPSVLHTYSSRPPAILPLYPCARCHGNEFIPRLQYVNSRLSWECGSNASMRGNSDKGAHHCC